ncbi:MAG: RNA polymerase sigma factor, partial [Phycisphaerales bacterium]
MADRAAQLDADYELMQRVSLDDESAVSELYDRFGPLVYRMAYQMMPTRADADDAVQEVFVRLWRTAGRYDPKRAALVTWVMMLSRRILVDRLRRQKARIKASTMNDAIPPEAGGEAVGTGIERDERFAALMKKIEQLPELQRIVVTRSYLDGMTLRQIGIELNK